VKQLPMILIGTISIPFSGIPVYTGHTSAEWILQWWQTKQAEYPCMARATCDYLPIPASEVDMERTFSDGRDILRIRRWRMKGNTFRVEIGNHYLEKQAEERAERRRRLDQLKK
jgi:hypothetical protein